MNYYRITKYNPEFRDKEGHYTKNDWTSISDIGQSFADGVLTVEKYKQTEDAYVETIKVILTEKGISKMTICGLEKNDVGEEDFFSPEERSFFSRIENNFRIEIHEIELMIRLALREMVWCSLLTNEGNVRIEFGYDYYMYVRCNKIEERTKQRILDNGLFVELL